MKMHKHHLPDFDVVLVGPQSEVDRYRRFVAGLYGDGVCDAVKQCESERRACERLVERFPKNQVHATGVLIADVCARRVATPLPGEGTDG